MKTNNSLRRVIVDYKKLTPKILAMLVNKYPDGYDDNHIITFKNSKSEVVEAVEVTTKDTMYLVKVSSRLAVTMANYAEDDYASFEANTPETAQPPEDLEA